MRELELRLDKLNWVIDTHECTPRPIYTRARSVRSANVQLYNGYRLFIREWEDGMYRICLSTRPSTWYENVSPLMAQCLLYELAERSRYHEAEHAA